VSQEVPLPPDDAITRPWWDATRERRLLLQRCEGCGRVQHPPRAVCAACGSAALGWRAAAGTGIVDAFTVVRRAPRAGFDPPYVVARVRLDEGPILLTNLVEADGVGCDARVRLRWRPLSDGRHLPVFAPERT
jgi:uncharacterized OB-fold protein